MPRAPRRIVLVAVLALAATGIPRGPAGAQELEPRFFSQAPVGMNFVVLSALSMRGGVTFDQATTIEDATGRVWGVGPAYVRTIGLLGFSAKISAAVPFLWGDWKGRYQGEPASASRRGFADPAFGLSVNFLGAPAMTLADMRGFRQKWVAGASVKVTAPLGQYDPSRLLNLGTNRWAFRYRLGVSRKFTRLSLEAMGSVWVFTDNREFLGESLLQQEPLWSAQLDAIYELPSRVWFGFGIGLARGGQAKPNGIASDTYRKNTRWGMIVSYPLGRRHSLKASYISQLSTRVGEDFDRFEVGWSVRFGGEG